MPKAPGTAGTAFAVPLFWFLSDRSWFFKISFLVFILAVGTWSAQVFDRTMETGDNQCIVIDEVLGFGITAFFLSSHSPAWMWLAAFILFRLFDIIKIPPVRQLDRWSKKKAREPNLLAAAWGGFGVMGDDLLAGLQALGVMMMITRFLISR